MEAMVPERKSVAVPAVRTNPTDASDPAGTRERRPRDAGMTDPRRTTKATVAHTAAAHAAAAHATVTHATVTHAAVAPAAMSPAAPGKRGKRCAHTDRRDRRQYDHQLPHDGNLLLQQRRRRLPQTLPMNPS
jgi:hypothetical protein